MSATAAERLRAIEEFTDVTYEVDEGLAWITINRPERYNAFRACTVDELVMAFKRPWASDEVGVVALTGAGDKAFCAGGERSTRSASPTFQVPRGLGARS